MFKNFKKPKNNYSQVDNIINIHNITNEDALRILSNEFFKIQNEVKDNLFSMTNAVMKLSMFWKNFDCRTFIDQVCIFLIFK